ncbi:XdhC/CoxI family protein [Roseisolibacter sp. H3M3-2]|uniref:XdhC family protein n=1 Tax=Roseisolibacter sp. H3M3-2 TaxID=3031323 RepID=UPI0023DA5E92|nr:XdhC/CoxI family protein [Roseisolibacter sp. H3M3-2]MDF1504534.1 XdhC family protein [Roseisolibacter sp. H3M3-2]
MSTLPQIVDALARAAAAREAVVLATVVRVVGSSYGGVGARMLARVDGTTVGLVSGGCLESDLAEHARRVHAAGRAEVVAYDTRADDDAVWGLGLGCNGLVEVLLQPLDADVAARVAARLGRSLAGDAPAVLATVAGSRDAAMRVGTQALLGEGDAAWALAADAHRAAALANGRRGLVAEVGDVDVAFEVVVPATRLLVCGSGPDAVPVVRLAVNLGWDVTVADHRPLAHARPERFAGARVVSCADASRIAEAVDVRASTAAVVMSHHFARDTEYVGALLAAGARYVGVLGPRSRTDRMLAELATRGAPLDGADERLFGPIGLDVGGDGPEAIALAIVAEASAVASGRAGGSLRDRRAPLHAPAPLPA